MPRPELFLDSSVLFAGVVSPDGAARVLLLLAEVGLVTVTVCEQVVAETERAVARMVPQALPYYREALRSTGLRIVRDPSPEEVEAHQDIIAHQADVPIVVAATRADVDYLVTLNHQHFIDDSDVAVRLGLRICAPGDALARVQEKWRQQ